MTASCEKSWRRKMLVFYMYIHAILFLFGISKGKNQLHFFEFFTYDLRYERLEAGVDVVYHDGRKQKRCMYLPSFISIANYMYTTITVFLTISFKIPSRPQNWLENCNIKQTLQKSESADKAFGSKNVVETIITRGTLIRKVQYKCLSDTDVEFVKKVLFFY